MQRELTRWFEKTYKVIFSKELKLRNYEGVVAGVELLLRDFSYAWYEQSQHYPKKGTNGAPYTDRAKYWARSGEMYALVLPEADKTRGMGVRCVHLTNIKFMQQSIRARAEYADGRIVRDLIVPLSCIVPLFDSYTRDFTGMLKFLKDYETYTHKESVDDIDGYGEQRFTVNTDAKDWPINAQINGDCKVSGTKTESNKETKTMNKFNSTVSNVASTGKNSISMAAGVTAGNATNAVVKAALRPALEPALRKLLQPKGLVQRTLGKGKVEDSVSAIMDSPMMDVLAATMLVTIVSSGLIQNDKLVKGSELASDAAMLKLFGLIDFDAVVATVTEKVTGIVSTLEQGDKAE